MVPKGAFYVFPCIRSSGMTSEEFARRLLEREKVAVVPGTAFGVCGEGYVRCSYATSMKEIREALERIEEFLNYASSCKFRMISSPFLSRSFSNASHTAGS